MKKYIQNIWVRLIACLLCAVSVLGLVVGIVGLLFFTEHPQKETLRKTGHEKIMQSYALYAVDYLQYLDTMEFLDKTNLYMTVEKVQVDTEGSENAIVTTVYSNMPANVKPIYTMEEIYLSSAKIYGLDSLAQAITGHYYPSSEDRMEAVAIDGYVFDVNTGLFYYHTEKGYFKADYVYVSEGGVSYDYRLTNKNGSEIYYNSYYDRALNTTNYLEWDWIQLSVKKMGITSEYYGAMVQLIGDTSVVEQNECTMNYYVDYYHIYHISDEIPYYQVSMALMEPMEKNDFFVEYDELLTFAYGFQDKMLVVSTISLLGFLIGVVLLSVSAPEEKEKLRFFHKIPILIFTGITVLVEVLFVACIALFVSYISDHLNWNVEILSFVGTIAFILGIMLFIGFVYLANLMTRIKTKCFFRYSELYYVSRPVIYLRDAIRDNMGLFWKGVFALLVISFVEFALLWINQYEPNHLFAIFIIVKMLEIPMVMFVLIQLKKLRDGAKRVASGDLKQVISTKNMYGVFKEHAEDINRVTDGIAIAVEEQMKSERFKTELITNVSHDIKTPLTSIINYVDLIKKEEMSDATMVEYVEVLDRQSARLKKLIDDLMEASKASTGNLEVNLEECDMGVLLSQVVGEFEDKLAASGLEAVLNKPEESVNVMADGRHIWRVLDNLLNNVCKYSQENTRVYISLEKRGNEAFIVFKNISKVPLNIPSEELMQRFVRGDSSRHTEGSGLGLSIAKSLVELMDGTMKLDIDGDLFKVTLKFYAIA